MTKFLALALSTIISVGVFLVLTRDSRESLDSGNHSNPLLVNAMENHSLSQARVNSVFFEDAAETNTHQSDHIRNPAARPTEVSARQFKQLVSQGVVLVKFGATWCGPCRKVAPELEQLATNNAGSVKVLTVDIDQEQALAERHQVGTIPHMLLFRNGEQVHQWTGFEKASQMQRQIDKAKASLIKGGVRTNPFTT